jgi:aldehyde:ferredoxin oxidoreductase
MCLFARKVYDRDNILMALTAMGHYLTNDNLTAIGQRILATKMRIKKALGFDLNHIRLPKRFFETPSMRGQLDEATAYEIIKKYKKLISKI